MNRPTRVPASTVVRIKRASNMIAKWYQNASNPPRKAVAFEKMYAIPTASVGAPPVRATILLSPTSVAVCEIVSGLTENPRPETADAADSAVPPTTAAGALMGEEKPGPGTAAAVMALTGE